MAIIAVTKHFTALHAVVLAAIFQECREAAICRPFGGAKWKSPIQEMPRLFRFHPETCAPCMWAGRPS